MALNITPEIVLWCSTQPTNIAQLFISPWFIGILVFVIIFTPLGIIGILSLVSRLRNWSRSRDGWIKIRKKLSNYHWIVFWSRPTGRKIKIKGEEGIEIEIPFMTEANAKDKDGKPVRTIMMGVEKELDLSFPKESK